MKKLFLMITAVAMGFQLSAQEVSGFAAAPTDGYRGFASLNVFSGIGDYLYDRFAITTSHGFQVDNLFMGLGASMQWVTNNEDSRYYYYYDENTDSYTEYEDIDFVMPFFFNINYEIPMGKFAPFADLKLGYTVGDANGLYALPTVGVRLAHFSVWCGYNLLQDRQVQYHENIKTTNYQSIAFGVSIDWGGRK